MTRAQIVAVTANAVRRVLANKTAVTPVKERHRRRLAELSLEQAERQGFIETKAEAEPLQVGVAVGAYIRVP